MRARLVSAILVALGASAWFFHMVSKIRAAGRPAYLLANAKRWDTLYASPHHPLYYVMLGTMLVASVIVAYELLAAAIRAFFNGGETTTPPPTAPDASLLPRNARTPAARLP